MNSDLETFNYFIDDLLSSEVNLLKYELDVLLMQYVFNSIDLEGLNDLYIQENFMNAAQKQIMKYFYEKFWVPLLGGILSKFVFLIEGKQKKIEKKNKNKI